MQRIRSVAISLVSVAAIGALAACSDQFPIGPPGARHSPASNPRSSAAMIAPNTRICSDPTTTSVQYNGNWVAAFLTDLAAVNASYPGAYAAPIVGSVWISPTPTSGTTADPGDYYFRTTFDLPAAGAFTNAAITGGQVHADNSVTIDLNSTQIFQHAGTIDGANFRDPAESFSASTGFLAGTNTLTFVLFNQIAGAPNPAALNFCLTVDYTAIDLPDVQDISFTSVAPDPATVGDTYLVTATASSGLAVTFTSPTPAVCTLAGATLSFVGQGSCSVVADQAGDASFLAAASQTQSFNVTWAFGGFLQPVDNLPTVNIAKAGSAIPVKFSLGGDYGLNIFVAGSPSTLPVACTSSLQTNTIEETVSTTLSGLSYDAATDVYHLVWKSDKSWTGSCRQLSLMFADGTEYRATFEFR
jgi:hypothetical protein